MGLDMRWIGAGGEVLDEVFDPEFHFAWALARVPAGSFPLLTAIDIYSDTNVYPSAAFTRELEQFRAAQSEPEVALHVSRVVAIARASEMVPGSLLEFLGD